MRRWQEMCFTKTCIICIAHELTGFFLIGALLLKGIHKQTKMPVLKYLSIKTHPI